MPQAGGTGAVYVFVATQAGEPFSVQRVLLPPRSLHPLAAGDLFGHSVALRSNLLVVGAPGRDDPTALYMGSSSVRVNRSMAVDRHTDTGAAFVFQRRSASLAFSFLEKLEGSNIKPFDRFGLSVDVYDRCGDFPMHVLEWIVTIVFC